MRQNYICASIDPAISNVLSIKIPARIYLLKVNSRNTRTRCEICSKLTIKLPERCHWRLSGNFIVNFEHISYFVLVFLLLALNRYKFSHNTIPATKLLFLQDGCTALMFSCYDGHEATVKFLLGMHFFAFENRATNIFKMN